VSKGLREEPLVRVPSLLPLSWGTWGTVLALLSLSFLCWDVEELDPQAQCTPRRKHPGGLGDIVAAV
jgi:hypothetical protein